MLRKSMTTNKFLLCDPYIREAESRLPYFYCYFSLYQNTITVLNTLQNWIKLDIKIVTTKKVVHMLKSVT